MTNAIRFPKTPRLRELSTQDIHRLWKRHSVVVEEKIDGANVGVWFDGEELRLQSRGHVLHGGAGERQFSAFHGWAGGRYQELLGALGQRYVLYGEWCWAKHRAFYDALPDWFLGFDVQDRYTGIRLATGPRNAILESCRITSVPRIWSGTFGKAPAFSSYLGLSSLKTPRWREGLLREAARSGVRDPMPETDNSDWMEGIYIRVEDASGLVASAKLHREGFEKVRNDSWKERPLIKNILGA